MAIIQCEVQRNNLYQVYIEYTVSQNPKTAVSTITHALKLKQISNTRFNGNMDITYAIAEKSYTYNGNLNISDKGYNGYVITIKSGTTTVNHNTSTGIGSFNVNCSGNCNSGGYGPGKISLAEKTVTLPAIDRVAPAVTVSVSNISTSAFTVSASANSECDIWQYSLDNESNWHNLSSATGKSASKSITGLSPNTTYNVKVRARRKYNEVYGISYAKSVTTLGNTLLNSVSSVSADIPIPVISMNWTVYAEYKHTLVIKDGSATVLTITDLTCSTGTNNMTVTLTAEQRTDILTYMTNKKSFTATFELKTYSGSTQIGSTVSKTATVQTTSGTSAPTFSSFTHSDNDDNGTVAITGSDQLYIKGYSILKIIIGTVSAKNQASISSYKVTVGSESKSFTTTTIEYGTIGVSGNNITLKVEVIDSRGYSTAISKTITVIDYADVSITDYTIRRKNEVEATVQLAFSGDISPIRIDNESQNGVVSAKFRYAPNGGSWSGWSNLTVAETLGSFEFATLELSNSSGVLEFDPNSQYTISIKITDRLSSDTMTIILNKGTPLVAFRAKKVGINTPNPQSALDVRDGNIMMNGFNVMGLVAELGDREDLHDLITSGIWTQHLNANASVDRHYPVQKAGYLEVFTNPQGYVMQRYTAFDCSGIYICCFYNNSWSAWKSIILS